jgi:oligoribonuclease
MAQDQNALVWLDMEMTGLNPDGDRIIELALVVTNNNLDIIAEAPVWVVHQSGRGAGRHGRVEPQYPRQVRPDRRGSRILDPDRGAGRGAGAGVHAPPRAAGDDADVRQFDLPGPALHGPLHAEAGRLVPLPQPRRVDAQGTVQALEAGSGEGLKKQGKHEALADILESIAELKYYREHFIKV